MRAMKQRAAKKPPVPDTAGATTAVVIENVAQTRRLQETALHDDRPTNTGSGSNEDDHDDRYNPYLFLSLPLIVFIALTRPLLFSILTNLCLITVNAWLIVVCT